MQKEYIERAFPAESTRQDLARYSRQKSFYKKAYIRDKSTQQAECVWLFSYETPVAAVVNGKFRRIWGGWSATTARHVDAFCRMMGVPLFGKAVWDSLLCFPTSAPELQALPAPFAWEAAEI